MNTAKLLLRYGATALGILSAAVVSGVVVGGAAFTLSLLGSDGSPMSAGEEAGWGFLMIYGSFAGFVFGLFGAAKFCLSRVTSPESLRVVA